MNKSLKYFAIGASIITLSVGAYFLYNYNQHQKLIQEIQQSNTLKIASFNIQQFGKSKIKDKEVVDTLVRIVTNFDILAIQEVHDKEERIMPYFIDQINKKSSIKYNYIMSPRLGTHEPRENYAFIYNTASVSHTGFEKVYSSTNNEFSRPPYMASFSSGSFDFILVDVHTKPDNAKSEIHSLESVVIQATALTGEKDIIVLGDFNADGAYFSESINIGYRSDNFMWLTSDSLDSTVAKSKNTYDRIVIQKNYTIEDYAGESGVFRFDEKYLIKDPTKISDHYPVWALFYKNKDTE